MSIADVIKYEGRNDVFVWKHKDEDFKVGTQLIVHESQEAVFFMNGQALDLFGPGRYTLDTENLPLIGKAISKVAGGSNAFHCEVYFINKAVQMALKWGTDSRIRFIEPDLGIPLDIGASGEMNLQVADSRKLLVKLVGTMRGIAWGSESNDFTKSLQNAFRPMISTQIKANLAHTIKAEQINILEIDEKLLELSESLGKKVSAGFEEYGLIIPQFYVTNIVLPEEDPNFKRLRELQTITMQTRLAKAEAVIKTAQAQTEAAVTAARRQIEIERQTTQTEAQRMEEERTLMKMKYEAEQRKVEAQSMADITRMQGYADADVTAAQGKAEAEVMAAKGYTQKDVLQAEVQKAYAEGIGNMGGEGHSSSGIVGDMLGLGVGIAAAGTVAPQMGEMLKNFNAGIAQTNAPQQNQIRCPRCGIALPANAKFCLECGTPIANKCRSCGADIPAGGKYCLECGTKV